MLAGGVFRRILNRRGDQPALLARVFVSAVFGLSALGKLLDPLSLVDSLRSLGWSNPRLAAAGAAVLLCLEFAVAYGLWPARHRLAAGRLALGLSACFVLVTAYRMAIGSAGDCGCFGLLIHLAPPATLALDVVLLVAAVAVAQADGAVVPGDWLPDREWLRRHRYPVAAGAVGLVPLTALYAYAWRLGHAPTVNEPLPRVVLCGQPAPALSLIDADGHPRTEADLLGEWHLLLFSEIGCRACEWMFDDLRGRAEEWGRRLAVWVIEARARSAQDREATAARCRQVEERLALPVAAMAAADTDTIDRWLGADVRYPMGFLIDPEGIVRHVIDGYTKGGMSLGDELTTWLARRPVGRTSAEQTIWYDRPAADATLELLGGATIDVVDASDRRPVVITFATNTCGACQSHISTAIHLAHMGLDAHICLALPDRSQAEALKLDLEQRGTDQLPELAVGSVHARRALAVTTVPTTILLHRRRFVFVSTPSSLAAELLSSLSDLGPRDFSTTVDHRAQ